MHNRHEKLRGGFLSWAAMLCLYEVERCRQRKGRCPAKRRSRDLAFRAQSGRHGALSPARVFKGLVGGNVAAGVVESEERLSTLADTLTSCPPRRFHVYGSPRTGGSHIAADDTDAPESLRVVFTTRPGDGDGIRFWRWARHSRRWTAFDSDSDSPPTPERLAFAPARDQREGRRRHRLDLPIAARVSLRLFLSYKLTVR